jgi:hypothetical protein
VIVLKGYPSIYHVGGHQHEIANIFDGIVSVQEKVDGSQFSFGFVDGKLQFKTRRTELDENTPPGHMFYPIVEYVKSISTGLMPGWIYRGEFLRTPRHNVLTYDRAPKNNFVLFDLESAFDQLFWSHDQLSDEAAKLGFDVIPQLYWGEVSGVAQIKQFLTNTSFLGGPKIEGVVIKNYLPTVEGKAPMIGKYVSDDFKEVQAGPAGHRVKNGDAIEEIGDMYCTEARWRKAVQVLRDSDKLEGSPRDIGQIVQEVQRDVLKEETESIKLALMAKYGKQIVNRSVAGLAEWYKRSLLEAAFEPAD